MQKNIVLIGMRGSGKTTIAHLLSRQLQCKMLDTDKEIESHEKMRSGKIINKFGIKFFREKEKALLRKIHPQNTIIATGGGIVLDLENRKILKKMGVIVYLFARPKILAKRIGNPETRPLLTNSKTMEDDQKILFKERNMIYKNLADHVINTEKLTPEETTQKIKSLLVEKFCIIGHPIRHSLSPIIYKAAFKQLSMNAVYKIIDTLDIKTAIQRLKKEHFAGASITAPHKIEAIKYLDRIDLIAKKIGSINTIKNNNGALIGYNTDWFGAIKSLLEREKTLNNKKIILLGTGGAARAIAFGLMKKKANFTVLDKDAMRAKLMAEEFNGRGFGSLKDFKKHTDANIIINATSVGMKNYFEDQSPIDVKFIRHSHTIFDIVYKPKNTTLIKAALKKGARVIYGCEMLMKQAEMQFKILTGKKMPVLKLNI